MNIAKKIWWMGSVVSVPDDETLLFGSDLSSAPADWSETAEFTFTGGVLNSVGNPANNGWSSFAGWSYLSSQERQRIFVNFNINSVTSIFRVLKYNSNAWAKAGSVAEVDFENSLLKLYNSFVYPTIPTVLQQTAITVTINTAHDYTLSFSKRDLQTVIILTNVTTGESTTLTRNQSGTGLPEGVFRGQVALMHKKGDIDYSGLYYYALNPSTPIIAIYGDSYVDGYSLSDALSQRWAYLVYGHESGDALVSGWGGNATLDLITRSKDFDNINPKNAILLIGYNDSSYDAWRLRLDSLINIIENKGGNVILCTYAPISGAASSANIGSMNTHILNKGYQFIDVAKVLTVGGDRTTIDLSLLLPDEVHPTDVGHGLIYNEYLTLTLYETKQVKLLAGLVSYWKLDANANDSKGINNGTLTGSPSSVAGKINNGYSFNGTSQYLTFADNILLSFAASGSFDRPFSISMWVNLNSLAAPVRLINKRGSGTFEYELVVATDGRVAFILYHNGLSAALLNVATPLSIIATGNWYHIVGTYDASAVYTGLKIYVNGTSQSLTNNSSGSYSAMTNTTAPVTIAGINTTAALNGIVDEVGIWSKKLTDAEVTALYNSGNGLSYDSFT